MSVSADADRLGGQVDGVAQLAGLHVDGQVEHVRVLVVAADKAHQCQHHLSDIAFTVNLLINFRTVVVQAHIQCGLATAVQLAELQAVDGGSGGYPRRVDLVLHGIHGTFVVVAAARYLRCLTVLAGGGEEVDRFVQADAVPTHRRHQGVRDVVHRHDVHSEVAVVGGIVGVDDVVLVVGQVEQTRVGRCRCRFAHRRQPIAVTCDGVGRRPRDGAQVQLAVLQGGRKHHLA